jgi:hypothetical protein
MKRTMMTVLLSTVVVLGIASCGSGSSGGPPSTLSGVCNDMGGATCQSMLKCSPGAMTQSQCVTLFVSGCCGNDGICGQAVSGVNASTYQQCKDALANMSCTDAASVTMPAVCNSI